MKYAEIPPDRRDYGELLVAVRELLAVLLRDGGEEAGLRASFEAVARGFGAQKALLLRVDGREPLRLRAIHTLGRLSPEQVAACERGESVRGVSPSVIRKVIATGQPELIEDPRLNEDASRTPSLADGAYSVLCAPILDRVRNVPRAVFYLQSSGLPEAYRATDVQWLELYAAAVEQLFGFHLLHERRTRELRRVVEERESAEGAPDILGTSRQTLELVESLHETYVRALAADRPDPILVLGERGTGKDLVARYVHAYSARQRRPFVVVNCAEITDELAASRFFGHKRGSFTGALTDEPGFFRAANGGVLFLDEVTELSARSQAHLLRVLENHTVTPVGLTREVPVDVAVILATNRNLEAAVRDGALRADFYDRFRTLAIRLLPLRDRPEDVPLLLEHFRRLQERKHRKRTRGFSAEALRSLVSFEWPGNVRELARACSLFVLHAREGEQIDRALLERCLPEVLRGSPNPKAGPVLWDGVEMEEAVSDFQRRLILSRLERYGGSVRAARESLGVTKTTFHRWMKELDISPQDATPEDP